MEHDIKGINLNVAQKCHIDKRLNNIQLSLKSRNLDSGIPINIKKMNKSRLLMAF